MHREQVEHYLHWSSTHQYAEYKEEMNRKSVFPLPAANPFQTHTQHNLTRDRDTAAASRPAGTIHSPRVTKFLPHRISLLGTAPKVRLEISNQFIHKLKRKFQTLSI